MSAKPFTLIEPQDPRAVPLVVQYLYLHDQGEQFYYPTARSNSSVAHLARRYLECALVQVASLRLREAECDLALATNINDRRMLDRKGAQLMDRIESFDVRILPTAYSHRPGDGSSIYASSRYVFDAILSATEGQPTDRPLWLTDLDCVWVDPQKVFTAAPAQSEIGCVVIPYPPEWDAAGVGESGRTRKQIGELSRGAADLPAWVGGELLGGTCGALKNMVSSAETVDARLAEDGRFLPTEEQVLSLAGALGEVRFHDLSSVAWRVMTGSRHHAPPAEDPLSLGLWHLPAEKGLSLRRAARDIRRGRTESLRHDLSDPARLGRRFNVAGTHLPRRVRDDSWIVMHRVGGLLRAWASTIKSRFSRYRGR